MRRQSGIDLTAGHAGRPDAVEVLYRGGRTRVCRVAHPHIEGATVIRKEMYGPRAGLRLQREVAVLRRLTGLEGIPELIDQPGEGMSMLMRDDGGTSVARNLPPHGFGPLWVAGFARRLTRIIAEVHRAGVTHKDINPSNIVIAADGSPVLIDYDLASSVAEERPGFTHPGQVAGTLAYLAPEQTGRIGRPVDHRADLYALGATLYELLTGGPPFGREDQSDPLALIHAHLTHRPRPPASLNAAVPPVLSGIVLRLLAKEPDQRYQSAEGLAHDLDRLKAMLDELPSGEIDFPLGERDFPLRLAAPSRLVGRDTEVAALESAFEAAREGRVRGLLVSGPPGVGKSALLEELRPMVTKAGGWLVAGKFDPYRKDPATDAVTQALRGLGRLMLAEKEADLADHRARLLAALGTSAGLVAGIPEFGALLGVAPSEPLQDDPAERTVQIHRAYLDTLRAISSYDHPVVLVLDDLQWAGAFPIGLLDSILTDDDLTGVLLVGAFRDTEMDATHPLTAMLARWERLGVVPRGLVLENLPEPDLATLLAEMLRLRPQGIADLAKVIASRTHGNPFDTVELVNALRRDGAVRLDQHGWSWDLPAIRRFVGSGDVADLLAIRIRRLPEDTLRLVRTMACLGGQVELTLLANAAGRTEEYVSERLGPALEDGLLIPITVDQAQPFTAVRFRHDRVQQAAYADQDLQSRANLHLDIARTLADEPDAGGIAAKQYLPVIGVVRDPVELRRAARLFLSAATAVQMTNAAMARTYLVAATQALTDIGVPADDPLLAAVRQQHHAALYALGRPLEADALYEVIARHNPGALDIAAATSLQVGSLANRERYAEAMELGFETLRRLGIDTPTSEDFGEEITKGLLELRSWAEDNDVDGDLHRPDLSDPALVAGAKILDRVMPAALFADQAALAWLVVQAQRIWAVHGPCQELVGPVGYSGPVVIGALGDYRIGYTATRRLLTVAEKWKREPAIAHARIFFTFGGCQWLESLEASVEQSRLAVAGSLRGGDLYTAGYAYCTLIPAVVEFVPTLDDIEAEVGSALTFAQRMEHTSAATFLLPYRQMARAMRGLTASPGSFFDEEFDEEEHLARVGQNPLSLGSFHTMRAVAAAIFEDLPALVHHAALAMQVAPGSPGVYTNALARLVQGLATAQQIRAEGAGASGADRVRVLQDCRDWLAARAADSPVNFGHLVRLMDAELAWAMGDVRTATPAFDAALREADRRPRPWHHALIAERSAAFSFEEGLEAAGRRLLAEARDRYAAWGATGKVARLEHDHPFLADEPVSTTFTGTAGRSASGSGTSMSTSADRLDLLSVIKASQAVSREIVPSDLRRTLMRLVLEQAGAQRGYLLIDTDGHLVIEARAEIEGERAHVDLVTSAPASSEVVPTTLLTYVRRSGETVVLADATAEHPYSADEYFIKHRPLSVLALPIIGAGRLTAVLYLENNLIAGAFVPSRLAALRLLAAQAAISLDTALLYADLQQEVGERQRAEEAVRRLNSELEQRVRDRTAQLEATNRDLNAFAHTVSHDLRAPLRAIHGYSQIVLDEEAGQVSDRGRQLLVRIVDRSEHMQHLIDDLLAFSRMGRQSLSLRPVDLNELMRDVRRELEPDVQERAVEWNIGELPVVRGDWSMLRVVLVNLIGNSLKFTRSRTPATIEVGGRSGDDEIVVFVRDNGVGFDPRYVDRLFAVFERLHGDSEFEGTGIGLATARRIVERHGGRIWAESQPDQGALFSFSLPR